MLTRKARLDYLKSSIRKCLSGRGFDCPSCGHAGSTVVSRKYLFTSLRRCAACGLLFRAPTTSEAEFDRFYQDEYSEGFTTEVPSNAELARLVASAFAGSAKDYRRYIDVVCAVDPRAGISVLDFGCSWGYGSWQFRAAGFDVASFELSVRRCAYAREKLGIDAHCDLARIDRKFDVFFSAHVLEHIPGVASVFELARKYLKPGGALVAITPNGSSDVRSSDPRAWDRGWGFVHPLFLDKEYYARRFADQPCYIGSSPFDLAGLRKWSGPGLQERGSRVGRTDGEELLLVARY